MYLYVSKRQREKKGYMDNKRQRCCMMIFYLWHTIKDLSLTHSIPEVFLCVPRNLLSSEGSFVNGLCLKTKICRICLWSMVTTEKKATTNVTP